MNTNIFIWNKITFCIHYEGLKLMAIEQTSKNIYNQAEKIYEKNIWNELRVRFNWNSKIAQRKRARPITQSSVELLLKKKLHVNKLNSIKPWEIFKITRFCLI